jgi:hypothetical protein
LRALGRSVAGQVDGTLVLQFVPLGQAASPEDIVPKMLNTVKCVALLREVLIVRVSLLLADHVTQARPDA